MPKGPRIFLALALIANLGSAAPVSWALAQIPDSVPVFGANASYEKRTGNVTVRIEDFFTADNETPGTVVHLIRPGVQITGDFPYDWTHGPRLAMIMISRDEDDCGVVVTFDPASQGIIRSRNLCSQAFTDAEIEETRNALETARREVHQPRFIIQLVRPQQTEY